MNGIQILVSLLFGVGVLSVLISIFRGIGFNMILNPDALVIVIGGTMIALFVAYPYKRIKEALIDIVKIVMNKSDRKDLIRVIVSLARINRKGGVRALERNFSAVKDDFLRLGVHLLVNNHGSEEIRKIMSREMALRIVHYNFIQGLLKTVARLTPSLGLAGTVIGLIKMFRNFDSVETMVPLMAVALMSTFYGVIIANLFVVPLSAKVKERAIFSEALMNLSIEGVIAMHSMDHPLKIEERLQDTVEVGDEYDLTYTDQHLAMNGSSG